MGNFQTSKDILSASNIFSPNRNMQADGKKPTAYEFQDYAYRLARDLNDLQNIKIYMKLTKTTERHLLEKAYSFVIDSKTPEKGKLFMWRLKQIRVELKRKQSKLDYTYENILEQMKLTRNALATKILEGKDDLELGEFELPVSTKKPKVLIIGNISNKLPSVFILKGYRVLALDVSKNLNNEIRKIYKDEKLYSSLNKDFFSKDFGKAKFDIIIINKYWNFVPLKKETDFIKKLKSISSDSTTILLKTNTVIQTKEEWKELKLGDEIYLYFDKSNIKEDLEAKFKKEGFKLFKATKSVYLFQFGK